MTITPPAAALLLMAAIGAKPAAIPDFTKGAKMLNEC